MGSLILSSLLSLIALVDSNPTTVTCINSTIVQSVQVEGESNEPSGVAWLKEKWMGKCGPFTANELDQVQTLHNWFKSRSLSAAPVKVILDRNGGVYASESYVVMPLDKLGAEGALPRLLAKSLLKQNGHKLNGVGGEISVDLVLADAFGEGYVTKEWQLDGRGLYGEFTSLDRDCDRKLVPMDIEKVVCVADEYKKQAGRISPWAYRWLALETFKYLRNNHGILLSVQTSRNFLELTKVLDSDASLSQPISALSTLDQQVKKIFSLVDPGLDCYPLWQKEFQQMQVVIATEAQNIRLAEPLPKHTLLLGFDSGFRLVGGGALSLDESEVFSRTSRVAFVGCNAPTVSEILQYAGQNKRLLYIENCVGEAPVKLSLFEKYGATGIEEENPSLRFVQFHQPSVRLAMDWGLMQKSSFRFSKSNQDTPERLRRLFGWNKKLSRRVSAPLPIVDIFNARKDETLTLTQ